MDTQDNNTINKIRMNLTTHSIPAYFLDFKYCQFIDESINNCSKQINYKNNNIIQNKNKNTSLASRILPQRINLFKTQAARTRYKRQLARARAQAHACAYVADDAICTATFDTDSVAIIIDTGATAAFTHCLRDFISFTPISSKVSGLGDLSIKGIGTVLYKIKNDQNELISLQVKNAFYVPDLKTRLVSPQQLCQQSKTRCQYEGDAHFFRLRWGSQSKTIPLSKSNNLPVLNTAPGTTLGQEISASLARTNNLYRAAKTVPQYTLRSDLLLAPEGDDDEEGIFTSTSSPHNSKSPDIKLKCHTQKCADCKQIRIDEKGNEIDLSQLNNLTKLQQEFLHVHAAMGHPNFQVMKNMVTEGLLDSKFKKVAIPQCLSCIMGKQHRLRRETNNKLIGQHIKAPGDLIHMDQCSVTTPGRPMTLSGKTTKITINCFTIFIDSISKRIFVEFQSSTDAEQTLAGKHRMERFAHRYDVKIKSLRADNGTFRAKDFVEDATKYQQEITFCGVNAHHQNGIAEHYIRTIIERARTNFLHAAIKWKDGIDSSLWTFAVNHAVHQWNNTPRKDLHYASPEEVFTGHTNRDIDQNDNIIKSNIAKSFHPFGCPVYVLKNELQKNETIPKFDSRSRTGVFLGYSSSHARNVALVLNLKTNHISPQYHVVYDDTFSTLETSKVCKLLEIWDDLAYKQPTLKYKIDLTSDDFNAPLQTVPPSNETSNSATPNITKSKQRRKRQSTNNKSKDNVTSTGSSSQRETKVPELISTSSEGAEDSDQLQSSGIEDDLVDIRTLIPTPSTVSTPTKKRHGSYIPDPTKQSSASGTRKSQRTKRKSKRLAAEASIRESMMSMAANMAAQNGQHKCMNLQDTIDRHLDLSKLDDGTINDMHPWALAASANPNILTHREAKKADDWKHFQEAMKEEIERMIKNKLFKLTARSTVPMGQRILRAVWSHRRKTTPDGKIYRHRSRMCVDGSQQQHGID